MLELLQLALTYLRGMWNRRWIGLAAAWIAAIVGVAYVSRIPDRYEASARVYVDTQSLLRPVMAGLSIQPSLEQQAALVSRTLITRSNVERVATMTFADLPGNGTAGTPDALIDTMLGSLQLTGDARSNSYLITYRDTDPQRAKDVVQALLKIFVDSSLGDKRQDTRSALAFVDEQIQRYEQSLQTAESRLKDFKLKYMGIAGQGGQAGQDFFARMSKLNDDIASARLELSAAIQSRDSYRRALSGEAATVQVPQGNTFTPAPVYEIDQRISAQRIKLDELLRSYTESHPEVIGTRRVLAELEQQRKVESRERELLASTRPGRPTQAAEQNPVFQKMRVSLADAEANVASLSAKLASLEGQYAQLKASARLVPQVEAEYAQLNRDYDIQKKTYSDLLARREAATMGADVQASEAGLFRIVDPPRVSPSPLRPTRLMRLGLAFLASLGIGLLASFVANELRPTFHDARSLNSVTDRPVLGALSIARNEASAKASRRDLMLFVGGVGGLAAAFASVLAFGFLMARVS
jgi:polysaccharide chain length determinant protein (PEP-CTERM system associated)